jgi:general secretion pathway protein K
VLVAPPEVIAALPGMTPSALKEFLGIRPTLPRDPAAIAAALGPAQASATIEKSGFFRIRTTIRFENGRQTSSEVVIDLAGEQDPYRVLSWRDAVETTTDRARKLVGGSDDF